jgi:hypothetical protein
MNDTLDRLQAFWEQACSQYPSLPEEMGLDVSPWYRLNFWVGRELPALKGLTFEQFLGGEYEVFERHPGPMNHFTVGGIVPSTTEVFKSCVVGRALYSLDPDEHRKVLEQFGVGWAAFQTEYANDNSTNVNPVGCDRIGGIWVHLDYRRQGLGTFMEVKRWRNTPHATLYMKHAFRQTYTKAGYEMQKRVYEELVKRRLF